METLFYMDSPMGQNIQRHINHNIALEINKNKTLSTLSLMNAFGLQRIIHEPLIALIFPGPENQQFRNTLLESQATLNGLLYHR
jgi:hypothetical protein